MSGAGLIEQATYVTERAWKYASNTTSAFSKARSLVAGDAQFFSVAPRVDDLRRSLNSESLHDKRDGMKRIVAQMCKGSDMRYFFPDVVKNIHVPSIELRKLIYIFIVYYADDCPNETLLSISAFQKDLLDPSMHVRALALRMLASLRILAIHPVVMVAVKKCASDVAPVVRKTAALALVQMHTIARQELDRDSVRQLLRALLSDRSPDVVGAAALAYTRICPDEWDLVHGVYRRLCTILKECEEWGQVVLLRLLLRYARLHFVDPSGPFAAKAVRGSHASSRSGGEGSESEDVDDDATSASRSSFNVTPSLGYNVKMSDAAVEKHIDPDLLLLLNSTRPLLWSMNSATGVAAVALFRHCGTPRFQGACVKSVMRLLNTCTEGQIVVLHVIYDLLLLQRDAFLPYLKYFFLLPLDATDVRHVKLRILSHLVTPSTATEVFREFRSYLQQYNDVAVVEAIQGLTQVLQQYPPFASHTIRLVTPLFLNRTSSPAVIAEAVAVLRVLVLHGTDPIRISRLAFQLMLDIMEERITDPSAVATILWLAGENISKHPSLAAAAPDCFRVFAKRFGGLSSEVKRQVLTLGCKVWVHLQGNSELAERFKRMYRYVAELAKYDEDYTIRDEERLIEATFDRQSDTFTSVRTALLREKPLPDISDPYADRAGLEIGTFSHLLGSAVRVRDPLPAWSTEATSGVLRRSNEEICASNAAVSMFHSTLSEEGSGSTYTSGSGEKDSDDGDTALSSTYESSYSDLSDADDDGVDSNSESHCGVEVSSGAPGSQEGYDDASQTKPPPPKFTLKVTMRSAPPFVPPPHSDQTLAPVADRADTLPVDAPETLPAQTTSTESSPVV
ncbi:hypothetical protein JKF63_00803 [Porcisia hertigi]|uniref:Clathrin/coatomer adaptor adaptin-like N-terminal domain-containing protein n=1 Tax=Porcisia hertigi TaxID=2761500 RepID=A0A836HCA8_9TRYP|nr:hypothetical protein JKF63_00803 [Porcisia hertigi]